MQKHQSINLANISLKVFQLSFALHLNIIKKLVLNECFHGKKYPNFFFKKLIEKM